jgi:membrane protein
MTARMWAYADRLLTHGRHAHGQPLRKRVFVPLYALRVLIQVARLWVRERCPQKAAALAFQTALGLVPLVAVGLALLRASGQFGAESALVDFISRQVLPVSRDEISQHLLDWSHHVSVETAGVVGVVTVLVLAFVIAASVERIFNDIWRAETRRSLLQRVVVFYAIATLVPAFIGLSVYHAARYGLTSGAVGALGALGATFAGLFVANKWLPRTHVRWKPAIIGALLSAILFEAAKHAFKLYVAQVAWNKYSGIYGAIGLLPITLLWIYYSWLVVLFGAEVAFVVQHLDHLELLDRRSPQTDGLDKLNGQVAARIMTAIALEARQQRVLHRDDLARRFDLAIDITDRILRRLVERKLLVRTEGDPPGYILPRPPGDITLHQILAAFRGADVVAPGIRAASTAPLDAALTRIDDDLRTASVGITLEALIEARPEAEAKAVPT